MARLPKVLKKISETSATRRQPESFGTKGAPLNTQHPFYFGFLAAAGALIAITLLSALRSASQVFVLIIISLFLAMGLNPAVEMVEKRTKKRGPAVAAIVAFVILIVVLGAFVVIPPVVQQINDLVANGPQIIDSLRTNSTFKKLRSEEHTSELQSH